MLSKRVIFVQLRNMLCYSLPDGQNQTILWGIIVAWEQRNSWSLFMPLMFCGHLMYISSSGCVLLTLHGDNRGVWRGGGGKGSRRRSAGSPFSVRCGPWAPTHRAQQISKLCGSWVQEGGKEEHGKECTEMEIWPKQRGHSDEQTSSWRALRWAGHPTKKVEIYWTQTVDFMCCEVVALQDKVWQSGGKKFMHRNVQQNNVKTQRSIVLLFHIRPQEGVTVLFWTHVAWVEQGGGWDRSRNTTKHLTAFQNGLFFFDYLNALTVW